MSYPYYYSDIDGIETIQKLLFLVKMDIWYGVGKQRTDWQLVIAESAEQAMNHIKENWDGEEFGEILNYVSAKSPINALPSGFNNAE